MKSLSKILVKVLQRSVTWVLNWSGGWREDSVTRWNVCVRTFVEEMWSNLQLLRVFFDGGHQKGTFTLMFLWF